MKYFAVRDFTIEKLEKEVNRRLSFGWKLVGGIALSDKYTLRFYQAMTKED